MLKKPSFCHHKLWHQKSGSFFQHILTVWNIQFSVTKTHLACLSLEISFLDIVPSQSALRKALLASSISWWLFWYLALHLSKSLYDRFKFSEIFLASLILFFVFFAISLDFLMTSCWIWLLNVSATISCWPAWKPSSWRHNLKQFIEDWWFVYRGGSLISLIIENVKAKPMNANQSNVMFNEASLFIWRSKHKWNDPHIQ